MADDNFQTEEAIKIIEQIPKEIDKEIDVLKKLLNRREKFEEQQFNTSFQTLNDQVSTQNEHIADKLNALRSILVNVVEHLKKQVSYWQGRYKLFYAKLDRHPVLDGIASRCAKTGFALRKLLDESFPEWKKTLDLLDGEGITIGCTTHLDDFQNLWENLVQSTFVVTGQEDFVVRIMKKCFPTFCIRVLAADYLHDHVGKVTPYFVSEVDLRKCVSGDVLKLENLKRKQIKVQNAIAKKKKSHEMLEFKFEKSEDGMECVCKNITFEGDFKRQPNRETKVHEEKFRVVFVTEMESQTLWTMSLPLVVISASNQEMNGLASIMWQCFSTNVFSIDEETPTDMKWSSVAKMLKMKFAALSKSHNLTDSNIRHLKRQLFGDDKQPDDARVTLTKFCCNDMKRKMKNFNGIEDKEKAKAIPFSFWKWFLGAFNVIEDYLLAYWNEGLIMAFASRNEMKKNLLKCKESGTFILRFSDTEISDRDGVKNVHGRLKASVFCIKYPKTEETGKRKNADHQQFSEERVVEDLDLDDPPKNLANILKDERKLFYRYLYPGDKTRQELFDKYYKGKEKDKNNMVDFGYKKPSEIGCTVPELEQAVRQLNILNGRSSQADSEVDTKSRVIKKAKRKNDHLDVYQTEEDQTDTEEKEFLSQSSGNTSISPDYMEQSSEQSVPNFSFAVPGGNLNGDSVVPYSPNDVTSFTHMEEEVYAAGERNGTTLHPSFTNNEDIAFHNGESHTINDFILSVGGASTPVTVNQPLTGNDDLISGSGTDSTDLLYEVGCQQLQSLENNTKLTKQTLTELRQTLNHDQYMQLLSWTQKAVESDTIMPAQLAFIEDISNGMENGLCFDQILDEPGLNENDLSEDLQDIDDLFEQF